MMIWAQVLVRLLNLSETVLEGCELFNKMLVWKLQVQIASSFLILAEAASIKDPLI